MPYRVGCASVWGGIEDTEQDIETRAVKASIYSRSADGGKGGDIYYFSVCCADMMTRIAVADVMGHGKAVSEISGWVYDELKSYLNNPAGHEIIGHLNNSVEKRGYKAMTTVALASLIVREETLMFTYAGHPPILVRRHKEGRWLPASLDDQENGCNLPLGVMPYACFDQGRLDLEPGDKLFIYTDGLVEAPSRDGEMFGLDRLMDVLQQSGDDPPAQLKNNVLEHLSTHTGGISDHDDLTMLAVQAFM